MVGEVKKKKRIKQQTAVEEIGRERDNRGNEGLDECQFSLSYCLKTNGKNQHTALNLDSHFRLGELDEILNFLSLPPAPLSLSLPLEKSNEEQSRKKTERGRERQNESDNCAALG